MIIKFLQWNVWYKEKIENIAETISVINPDIFCLQELTVNSAYNQKINTAEYLAEKLRVNFYFKEAHRGKWLCGNGIFSKFPLTRQQHVYTQSPTTGADDYSQEGRVYIEVEINLGKDRILVGTTHASYTHRFIVTEQKKTEIDKLLKELKKHKSKFVFSGDLNSRPYSYTIKRISKILKNSGPPLNQNTWTTKPFNYKGFYEDKLNWRLDYVFATKDIKIESSKIINAGYSDHLPISVKLIL